MYYGGDYNPEQWPEEVWSDDIKLMQRAGVNLVSLGVFSWSRIQPDEGVFDFGWLDRIIDMLGDGGIGVNLATATASPPPWAIERYPDILPVTADGVVLHQGGRQHYSPTSPQYRRLAKDLAQRLAERYGQHAAVQMWHVNNEYACHVPYDYSDHAERAFREWLERRYGSIDCLNHAWNTAFWSQIYRSFEQVRVPRRAPNSQNPASVLDFRRFTSDAVLALFMMERDTIRATGALQPITTNFMGTFPPMDYWRWAREVDLVADDSYPDPRDPEAFREAAFARDLMRSLKPRTPWILMEQATNAVQWRPSNKQKAPRQMAALSEQAVARGAGGIMFFQWRQSTSGSEKFHSAMLPHAGCDTRTWKEIELLGQRLTALPEVGQPPVADAALVLDWENWWAIELPDHPARIDYMNTMRTWYEALHRAHVQTDIVHPAHDLSVYRLVVAPSLYLLTDESAANLRQFVEGGGVLLTTAFTDIVDQNDRFLPGGFATRMRDVFGGHPVDFDGVLAEDGIGATLDATRFSIDTLREEFVISTGTVLSSTSQGDPALVENHFGAGASLHSTVFPDRTGADLMLAHALALASVEPVLPGLPDVVEAIRTADGATLINQSPTATDVLVAGKSIPLGPFEVVPIAPADADERS
ncbi:beta-galactosidase [Streptomyces sp. NPDC048277]|uniref:beta-galactosidase n=1 Tax=Streptomyces sp. NPDC048277 TaxID=3155027 RepID=UPI0033EC14E8